jgi:hypothetical protein
MSFVLSPAATEQHPLLLPFPHAEGERGKPLRASRNLIHFGGAEMMTWLTLVVGWAVVGMVVAMWFGVMAMKGRMRRR